MASLRSSLIAVAASGLVAAGCLADDPDPNAAVIDGNGSLVLVMDEFSYLPSSITVDAGATIELIIVNEGSVEHEIMIGSSALSNGGYDDDLLARLLSGQTDDVLETALSQSDDQDPDCVDPAPDHDDGENADHSHDPPDLPPDCDASGPGEDPHGESDDHHDESEEPHGESDDHHDESEEPHGESDDHHDESEEPHDESDDHHDESDEPHDESDDHHDGTDGMVHGGGHITVPAGETHRIQLTIPLDAVGQWEMGCFLPGHYDAGMKGIVIVRPANAEA